MFTKRDIIQKFTKNSGIPIDLIKIIFQYYHTCTTCCTGIKISDVISSAFLNRDTCFDCCLFANKIEKCSACEWMLAPFLQGVAGHGKSTLIKDS